MEALYIVYSEFLERCIVRTEINFKEFKTRTKFTLVSYLEENKREAFTFQQENTSVRVSRKSKWILMILVGVTCKNCRLKFRIMLLRQAYKNKRQFENVGDPRKECDNA